MGQKKRALAASHPPPKTEAVAAQDAARPPKDDEEAQGKTANAEKMDEAQPKEFDKDAFIKAVEKAIAGKAPKNLDEADKFADSGKAEEVQAEVRGQVGQGKAGSAEEIATTTAAPPDTSAAVTKKVVPLTGDRPPGTPGAPDPAGAVPDTLPASATDLSAGPAEVERRMSDAQVTEKQLARSNEPSFNTALGEKKTAERHSAVAPGQMRKHEAGVLRSTTAQARQLGTAAMGAMGGQRVRTGQQVGAGKAGAKNRDEEKRAQVTTLLQGVFDTMKKDVEAILDGLDKLVDDEFTRGERLAREAFTAEHERKMEEYKDRRYSGVIGKARWVRDLFAGLPAEADQIFDTARDGYIRRMRQVISDVATTIGTELNRAKRRVAQGRTELNAAVHKLPADLRSIGREAAAEFSDKFDELTQSVDDKGTALVDTLATKYSEALKSVDEEIAAEKEKNKGLVAKAVDAVKAVINTILELKRLLLAVLAKAAQAVLLILKDPIGFLRNLVTAMGAGLRQFLRNIGTHLQQGIMSWLLGRTAEAGLQLPAKFDTQGIVSMLASLLGLTWQNIRARLTRKVPEQAVAAAETGVSLVVQVRKQGVAGMWEDLKSRVGDLRKDLMGKVIAYVTPTIVQAGIMWILSLLNPASAFVRAVKLIIDIVTFIVTRARQIFEFVNAVLDAVIAIARGGSGGVPALIERALARSIPVLLGFLASLLGVGGIAAKIKQIVQALAKPVNRAIDWVIDKIVGLVKKLWSKIKPRKKPAATPRDLPGRRRPGRRRPDRRRKRRKDGRPQRVAGPGRKRKRPDKRSEQDKKRALDAAVRDATRLLDGEGATVKSVRRGLPGIKKRHDLTRIQLKGVAEGKYRIKVTINPEAETPVEDLGDKFPYHIGPAEGNFKIRKHGKAVDQLNKVKVPMEGLDRRTGFVINMAAVPGEVKQNPDMAARYLHSAWKNPRTKELAAARTAVVIGVNTFEHLDPKNDSSVLSGAIDSVKRPLKLIMAVFGFVWTPRWLNKEKREVPMAEVRKAYRELSGAEKTLAESHEKGLRDKGALPYGLFREEVLNSSYTRDAVAILSAVNDQVHVVGQDADTGVAVSETLGVLAAYKKALDEMEKHPLITIGGYHFNDFDWGEHGDPRAKQLTLLANKLDRAIRDAVAKLHPQMLYPTEPNMLIKAWDRHQADGIFQSERLRALRGVQGGLYGIRSAEGRTLRNRLMEVFGEEFTVAYTPEASTTTSPLPGDRDRGLTRTPEDVQLAGQGLMRKKGGGEATVRVSHRMYALIIQSQSYASARTLAREFVYANPGLNNRVQRRLEGKIFIHVENVAMLMADNPRLTVNSWEIKAALKELSDDVNALIGERRQGPNGEQAQQSFRKAEAITREIVSAMTATELQEHWERIRTLLDDIMRDAPSEQGES
ncbi:hypothetical protein AB0P17_14475 [Streptomyces sp. NPDC088124]|uniref:phage tail protein n=1 Tax=Streptomyces sp. NPDC088124 TaxID=3154654 RepID=UPI00342CE8C2